MTDQHPAADEDAHGQVEQTCPEIHTYGLNDPLVPASFSGYGNNPSHRALGAAGGLLGRAAPPDYSDGKSSLAREQAPSARAVSNGINKWRGQGPPPADSEFSDLFWVFGQLTDHLLDLTEPGDEAANIPVPDPREPPLPPFRDISFTRSAPIFSATGLRQQPNELSSFIDGSNVYGESQERANALRTFCDGKLKTVPGPHGEELLPSNSQGLPNDPGPRNLPRDQQFLAGDIRSNEHALLTGIHTVFVREHNYWADIIGREKVDAGVADGTPRERDEKIYQRARKIVNAEMQAILYEEWLPLLLGPQFKEVHPYRGYNSSVDPTVVTEFSTVAFRIGHTMVSENLATDRAGSRLPLVRLFFNPQFVRDNGVDGLVLGAVGKPMQRIDQFVVEALRSLLFNPAAPVINDLAALNIQRGRDHGVPNYNGVRVAYGLDRVPLNDMADDFKEVYKNPRHVDPWPAGLAEKPVDGAKVGETFWAILADQFARSRDGDRFYYEHDPSLEKLRACIKSTRMADILNRTTNVGDRPVKDAFLVPPVPTEGEEEEEAGEQ